MTGKEIVKEILLLRKWSQSKLAEEVGKNQTNITGYLNRGKNEMRLDVFVEMVEAMGCEVIVRDKMGSSEKWRVKSVKLKTETAQTLKERGCDVIYTGTTTDRQELSKILSKIQIEL